MVKSAKNPFCSSDSNKTKGSCRKLYKNRWTKNIKTHLVKLFVAEEKKAKGIKQILQPKLFNVGIQEYDSDFNKIENSG